MTALQRNINDNRMIRKVYVWYCYSLIFDIFCRKNQNNKIDNCMGNSKAKPGIFIQT